MLQSEVATSSTQYVWSGAVSPGASACALRMELSNLEASVTDQPPELAWDKTPFPGWRATVIAWPWKPPRRTGLGEVRRVPEA
jgi:hypothetical protein